MPEKIIIDTDPGIDDTLAIYYALASEELELIGLTTIFGNAGTDLATLNALRLLEIAGRGDIPVAKGAQDTLTSKYGGAAGIVHGADGLGNVNLPLPKGKPIQQTAAEFIIEQIEKHPGEINLLPIGPLTNIALALRLQPDIVNKVKRVIIMGGAAFTPGNVSPAAEANIHDDPEAASVVFNAGWDLTMVGLDVTEKIFLSKDLVEVFANSPKETAKLISRVLPHYLAFYESKIGKPGCHMHDPSVIAYLLHPSLFEVGEFPVKVETQGLGRGKTWAYLPKHFWNPDIDTEKKVNVVLNADAEKVIKLMVDALI